MRVVETIKEAVQWLISLRADLFRGRSLVYLTLIAGLVTVVVGLLLYLIDPGIRSLFDGIWYAWVTMTHVGYGDVVPTSILGRMLAALLILFGLGLFALFTATFSAALIGEGIGRVDRGLSDVAKESHSIEREESQILKELRRLHERLDRLEQHLQFTSPIEAKITRAG